MDIDNEDYLLADAENIFFLKLGLWSHPVIFEARGSL